MGNRYGGTTDGSKGYADRSPALAERRNEQIAVQEAFSAFETDQRKQELDTDLDNASEGIEYVLDGTSGSTDIDNGVETSEPADSTATGRESGQTFKEAVDARAGLADEAEEPRAWHEAIQSREGYADMVVDEKARQATREPVEVEAESVYDRLSERMDNLSPVQSAVQGPRNTASGPDTGFDDDSFGQTSLAAASGILDELGGADSGDLASADDYGFIEQAESGSYAPSDVRTDQSGLGSELGAQRKAEMQRLERGTDIAGSYQWDKSEPVVSPEPDPRDSLSGEDLGAINDAARDLALEHDTEYAAISRQLGEMVSDESLDMDVETAVTSLESGLADGSATLDEPTVPNIDPRQRKTQIQQEEIEASFDHIQQIHDETADGVNTGERPGISRAAGAQDRISPQHVFPNGAKWETQPRTDRGELYSKIEERWGRNGLDNTTAANQMVNDMFTDGNAEIPVGDDSIKVPIRTQALIEATQNKIVSDAAEGNVPPRTAVANTVDQLRNSRELRHVFDNSVYRPQDSLDDKELEIVSNAQNILETDFPQVGSTEEDLAHCLIINENGHERGLVTDFVAEASQGDGFAWSPGQININESHVPLTNADHRELTREARQGERRQKYTLDEQEYISQQFQSGSQYIGRASDTGQPQYRTNVEGVIDNLEHPYQANQHQFGHLAPAADQLQSSTECRVTWWKSSSMHDKVTGRDEDAPIINGSRDYLREGDRVRFKNATVSQFEKSEGSGDFVNTVSIRDVTEIEIIEEGGGEIIYEGMGREQSSVEPTPQNLAVATWRRDKIDPENYDTIEDLEAATTPHPDARRPATADTTTAVRDIVPADGKFAATEGIDPSDWDMEFSPDAVAGRKNVETIESGEGDQQFDIITRKHGGPTSNPWKAKARDEHEKELQKGRSYQQSRERYEEYQRQRWDVSEEDYQSSDEEQRREDAESRRWSQRRDAQREFGYTDSEIHLDLPWPGHESERAPVGTTSNRTAPHRADNERYE